MKQRDSLGREYDARFMRRHGELTPARTLAMAQPGITLLPTRGALPTSDVELH